MLAPLLTLAAAAAFAPAPAPGAGLAGIWEGNVGNLPVRACFVRREWGSIGSYYYLSRRGLIALEAEEGPGDAFRENDARDANAPRWAIESADAARLTARWTHRGRMLPVRLSRIAAPDGEENPCGSLAYHQPRLAGVRTVTARASLEGVDYTRITLAHDGQFEANVETFALDGSSAAVERLNAALRESLAGDPPSWFDCIRTSLSHLSMEGSFNQRLAPSMISARWMSVVDQSDDFCGGAHPNHGQTYRTFDLASGGEIDLHDWFNATAVRRERLEGLDEESKTLEPALRAVILAGWTAEAAECGEAVRDTDFWNIGLTREALVFSPSLPHVIQACGEDFTIPFARLRPFLTDEGWANLRALEAEARRPPASRRGD